MKLPVRLPRFYHVCSLLLLISLLILGYQPVLGTEIPGTLSGSYGDASGGVMGRYDGYTVDNAATVGMGLFPTVILDPEIEPTPQMTIKPGSSTSWITISPFSGTLNGQETYMIAGYLSGSRSGSTLSIGRKASEMEDFEEIEKIKPDDTGLFVWLVPAEKAHGLFRVTSMGSSGNAVSNGIRFFAENKSELNSKPAISPVQVPSSLPSTTKTSTGSDAPKDSGASSAPVMTTMDLRASTFTPAVGEEVAISGRLTDSNGKGVSGATINLDETGYPGAQKAEPFMTTQTDSEGNFEFTITTKFANVVGLYAYYNGDNAHTRSESNVITFSSL